MNKLRLNTTIYSDTSVMSACLAYDGYASIKIQRSHDYIEVLFDQCKYAPELTMKEFENYLINCENTQR